MDGGQSFWSSAIVDYGYYASMIELIKSINTAMKKELGNTNITFSYIFNPRTHKVSVTLATKHCVGLYGQLSKILGYGRGDVKVRKSKESPYVADLHGITSIYVYCNIVQPVYADLCTVKTMNFWYNEQSSNTWFAINLSGCGTQCQPPTPAGCDNGTNKIFLCVVPPTWPP